MAIKVSGIKQVKSNLQKILEYKAGELTERSITAGAIQLSNYASELTPVDTSNLINSQYIVPATQTDRGWTSGVGYLADYAEDVHNGPNRRWQKEGAQNFFLTDAADRNTAALLRTIFSEYKKK